MKLLVAGVDIVDAVECCRGVAGMSETFLERRELFQRVRLVAAALFVVGEYGRRFLFVSFCLVRFGKEFVRVGVIYVVGIEVANLLALLDHVVVAMFLRRFG